jgi:hypothetical protein
MTCQKCNRKISLAFTANNEIFCAECAPPSLGRSDAYFLLEKEVEIGGEKMTLREFFKAVLTALIDEGECFNGKRPGFDSDWWHCLDECLPGDTNEQLKKAIGEL